MRGSSLLLASLLAGVFIILSTGASALITVGALEMPRGPAQIDVVGDTAYVMDDSRYTPDPRLHVVDVSDPASPVEIAAFRPPTYSRVCDIEVIGNLAYLADTRGLLIIDVSDPGSPVQIGRFFLPDSFQSVVDIEVLGDLVYMAGSSLYIVDVSDPASPVQIGVTDEWTWGQALTVDETRNLAFLLQSYGSGSRYSRLDVVDVSDPTSPIEIGTLALPDDDGAYEIDVEVLGELVYASADSLFAIDVSDPALPVVVGVLDHSGLFTGPYRDFQVVGDLAYAADPAYGLRVLDLSNPASPRALGSLHTGGDASDVEVVGDLAYIADTNGGLRIVDLSVSDYPRHLGSLERQDQAGPIEVVGDLAYVGNGASLRVMDVSDPDSPVQIGALATPEPITGVEVIGSLAYASAGTGGYGPGFLYVIDVSDPRSPVEIGALDLGLAAGGIEVSGSYAYVAIRAFDELLVIDVSDPSSPVEIGFFAGSHRFQDFEARGNRFYLIDQGSRLRVFEVSDPQLPTEICALDLRREGFRETSTSVAVAGNFAYVAITSRPIRGGPSEHRLQIVDLDPECPMEPVGSVEIETGANRLEVAEGFAYLVDSGGELRVIEASDPWSPVERGSLDTKYFWADFAVTGARVYVAASSSGLHVIDVSDPALPAEIAALDAPDTPNVVEVVGGLAYVADPVAGLGVIDVSDPDSLVEIGALDTPGEASGLAALGDRVYLADGSSGLRVIDVSDASAPLEVGALDTPGDALDVEVVGNLAYVADAGSGLRVIEVSSAGSPVEIGALDTPGDALDVAVAGDLVYVAAGASADGTGSLRIIDVSDPALPAELGYFATSSSALTVEVVESLAYVLTGDSEDFGGRSVHVIDVSNSYSPVEVGVYEAPNKVPFGSARVHDFSVVEHFVYLLESDPVLRALHIVDFSDPGSPVDLGATHVPNLGQDVEVSNGRAYVAGYGLDVVDFGPEYAIEIPIDLDIKPGSDPNAINPSIEGVIPVAILGSDSFDVVDVDGMTLAFGPDGAAPAHCHGPHLEDVNGDGLLDLMAHFGTEETGIEFGTLMACLSGEMLDGKPFNGCDTVRTVPDMDGDKLLDTEEASLGTNALSRDTDRDGFTDGEEVLVMMTDPLNAQDPAPLRARRGRGPRRR